jgi:DNA replication and repair protein RecF
MLQTLELANIRSYSNGLFEFTNGVNIIVGPNASGKTNLLEAIYFCAQGSAFRSEDGDMISRDSDWGRIDATIDDQTRVVKLRDRPTTKSFMLEGVEKNRLPAHRLLPVVLFEPYDMLLLGGEPERRRNYIDGILAQTEPGFIKLLKDYKRALSQRNKLLKQDQLLPEHLFVWDVRLSDMGGKLAEYRQGYVEVLRDQISNNYQSVSGNDETLDVSYESKVPVEHYANSMLQKLKLNYQLDRDRGFTSVGPHRDDIRITINSNDVRTNASRGETRSIVLALKMAEMKLLEQKTGKKPLLLLDDVFSELDGKRRRMLAQTLQEYQTFITTTDADVVIDHFSESCNIIPL